MQVIAILYSKVYVFGFDILEWKKTQYCLDQHFLSCPQGILTSSHTPDFSIFDWCQLGFFFFVVSLKRAEFIIFFGVKKHPS